MRLRIHPLIVSALLVGVFPPFAVAQTSDQGSGETSGSGQGADDTESTPSRRPFRGLFGLGDAQRTGLDLSGTLFGSYDDNIGATLPGVAVDPRYQRSGWYAGATGRVSYNWSGEHAAFGAWAGAGTNYYVDFGNSFVPNYSGGVGFERPLGQRNNFSASQAVAYSPYFLSGFFADAPSIDNSPVPPIGLYPDLAVSDNRIIRSVTSAALSRQLSRKATVGLSYGLNLSTYLDTDRRYVQQHGSIGFRRELTRHAGLRIGYGYRSIQQEGLIGLDDRSFQYEMHDVDVGIDYNRALAISMSRRTKLSFSTGSSIFVGRDVALGGVDARTRTYFSFVGSAQLSHEVGRTWTLALVYARTAGFSDLVFQPVTADSVSATASGLIGRRNEVSVSASTSNGAVGLGQGSDSYDSYMGRAQWRRALSAHLAATVSYLYYHHDFGQRVGLPLGFPSELDRQSVRVGLTVWLPLQPR